jgi:hypothetical protein
VTNGRWPVKEKILYGLSGQEKNLFSLFRLSCLFGQEKKVNFVVWSFWSVFNLNKEWLHGPLFLARWKTLSLISSACEKPYPWSSSPHEEPFPGSPSPLRGEGWGEGECFIPLPERINPIYVSLKIPHRSLLRIFLSQVIISPSLKILPVLAETMLMALQ